MIIHSKKENKTILFKDGYSCFEQLIDIRHEEKIGVKEYLPVCIENQEELLFINSFISDARNKKAYKMITETKLASYYGLYIEFLGEYIPTKDE